MYKQASIPLAHQLDEILFLLRHTINSVALRLEILQHLVDAAKHVQIGCCAHIPLVRWETEDCDGHLLLSDLLLGKAAAQARPCRLVLMCCIPAACPQLRAEEICENAPKKASEAVLSACCPMGIQLVGTPQTNSMSHAHMQQGTRTACQTRRRQKTGQGRRAGHNCLPGPLDGSAAEHIDTVRQRVTLAGVAVPSSKHNGLNATIELRQCYLHHHSAVTNSPKTGSRLQEFCLGVGLKLWVLCTTPHPFSVEQHPVQVTPSAPACSDHSCGVQIPSTRFLSPATVSKLTHQRPAIEA